VIVTPFGLDHEPDWSPADDLLVMADGGLLHLGGYPDVGPVVAYGGQSRFAASIFAAVAAVSAVIDREHTGSGGVYDVSAQECVAQALEDSAATYALTGRVRERQGDRAREAGSGIYACRDGYVSMVAGRLGTAKAWAALIAWLNEEGAPGAEELLAERWSDFAFRQTEAAVQEFQRVFEGFASTRSKAELYEAAQARMIALSPVNTVEDVLASPQLKARGFFTRVDDPDFSHGLIYPRAPYRMSGTPPIDPVAAPRAGEDNASFYIDELGLTGDEYISLVERGVV
jgi:benzylsuccinate CoA-transferase BbsE subunit